MNELQESEKVIGTTTEIDFVVVGRYTKPVAPGREDHVTMWYESAQDAIDAAKEENDLNQNGRAVPRPIEYVACSRTIATIIRPIPDEPVKPKGYQPLPPVTVTETRAAIKALDDAESYARTAPPGRGGDDVADAKAKIAALDIRRAGPISFAGQFGRWNETGKSTAYHRLFTIDRGVGMMPETITACGRTMPEPHLVRDDVHADPSTINHRFGRICKTCQRRHEYETWKNGLRTAVPNE